MAQRVHRRVVHANDRDVALLVRFHDCHGCAPSFTQYVGSVSPGLARALPKGYSAGTKHSREDEAMLRGLMMDRPLLVSSVIDYAAEVYPDVEIVSQTVEGGIHRYGYAAVARAHRPARQRADRPRHQAGRPGRHAGLERLPPLRALLCHRRHRRGLPHHQSAAVPRADHLHRQPRRGHGAVLRPHLPAAGREAQARAQDHQDLRADDRPRAHAGQRPARRPALLRGPAGRDADAPSSGRSSTRTPPARSATPRAPPASPRACSIPTARCCCTPSS